LKKRIVFSVLGIAAVSLLAFPRLFPSLLSTNYLPHRYCYLAQPGLVWTNVVTDSLIAISYVSIFCCLIWIARRLRRIPDTRNYLWIFISFGAFIVACGATHAMEVVTVWWPFYPLSATVKVICAAVSVPTAILFARVTPTLARNIRRFLEMQTKTVEQRDEALIALKVSEHLVAERQRTAKRLAGLSAQLTAVLESTSDRVMTIGHDWKILYGNRHAKDNLPDCKVGENFWTCFPGFLSTPSELNMRTAMEQRAEADFEDFYVPYGKWFKFHTFPIEDGLSIFFSDITEGRKLREQLLEEEILKEKRIEALSHMAGGLAHEISNPLAIIHGKASDLMLLTEGREQVLSAEVRKTCNTIVQTSDRAIRILRGLRLFAREATKDPMAFASVYEIVEQCIELQQDRFDRFQISVSQDIQPEIPLLLCREIQIEQILTNLLNNAFDAIVQSQSVERWISLAVEYEKGELFVDVTDSGPGIEEHLKAHLMEPFFTTKEFGLGMGVGLSLSRAIALNHGGSLILRTGTAHTCFRLTVPITQNTNNEDVEQNLNGVPLSS
jgi:C4-dicarboxylate-specific signal transduction histidine kinase